ncbi:MAG: protoheme IX farnesyltransferase [Pirellulales bacterium]
MKPHANHSTGSLTADVAALVRPRIAMMVLVTVFAAMWLTATPGTLAWLPVLAVLLGTGLVAASSSVANQILERESDRLMPRTASRPLASGRLSVAQGWWLTGASFAVGLGFVAWAGSPGAAIVAALTWLIYVIAYTPLKRVSPLNTAVGAVAGALPVGIGWLAADGPTRLLAGDAAGALATAALGTVLYLWQFPHFMAIAWLYRRQYSDAGLQMLTVADPSGLRAAGQSLAAALALVPVSLVLAVPSGSIRMFLTAGLASIVYACGAIWFAINRDDRSARRLLLTSLAVLLVLMAAAIGFGGPTDRSLGP